MTSRRTRLQPLCRVRRTNTPLTKLATGYIFSSKLSYGVVRLAIAPARLKVERGPVPRALLALLSDQPRHGYELRDLFEATAGGHWELNSGQIYSSLERLARDGLVVEASVEKVGGPDRRLWAITDQGRAELVEWFRSAVTRDYRLRDELYVKLMLAIATRVEEPYEVVQVQRRELFRELHEHTAARNRCDARAELPRILLLDSAIMHTEAELRWLDMVESRLQPLSRRPPPSVPARPRGRPRKATT